MLRGRPFSGMSGALHCRNSKTALSKMITNCKMNIKNENERRCVRRQCRQQCVIHQLLAVSVEIVYILRMKSRRIAVIACTGGAGHLRAAEALVLAAKNHPVPLDVHGFDVLDFTPTWFRRLYAQTYVELVNRTPELWGYFYHRTEQLPYRKHPLIRAFDRVNYGRYLRMLKELNPDAVLCTHFLPYISVSSTLRKSGWAPPVIAVTTDFDVHGLWIDPIVRTYCVFHEESAWQLASKGVPTDSIEITGIPVHPGFSRRAGRAGIRRALHIPTGEFTALVLSGGFGMGRVTDVVRTVVDALGQTRLDRTAVIAVCGRNEHARRSLESLPIPDRVRLVPMGFVDNMHELMAAADIVVTKSGGLTSAEALAIGVPLLIVDPIPGQESRNADLIVEHGAGWKAVNLPNIAYKLHQLISRPNLVRQARIAAADLGRSDAAKRILDMTIRRFLKPLKKMPRNVPTS